MNGTVHGIFILGESFHEVKVAANVFVLLLCLSGNFLVLYTLIKERLTRKPFEYILFHLAISDIGAVLFTVFLNLTHLLNGYKWPLGLTVCRVLRPWYRYFYFLGEAEILLIACVRYKAVVFPLKTKFQLKTVKRIIAISYVLFMSYFIFYAVNVTVSDGTCESKYPNSYNIGLYRYVLFFLIILLPTIVLAFTYCSIVVALVRRKDNLGLDPTSARLRHEQNIRSFSISISIVIFFALSWAPHFLSRKFMGDLTSNTSSQRSWFLNYHSWISLFAILSSNCTGPFIYGIFSKAIQRGYRKAAKNLLRR